MYEDGKPLTLYTSLSSFSGVPEADVVVKYNARGYLSRSKTVDPSSYYRPSLVGGSVEYDLDLSESNCGCISAFYLTKMPAVAENGSWAPGIDGMYYCDSSGYGGTACPDIDIMEANQFAMLTAPNPCDAPNENGHYAHCDNKEHCLRNTKDVLADDAFGPGQQYVINTLKEIHVKISFNEIDDKFSSYTTTVSQDGREISLNGDCPEYVDRLTEHLREGMAFAVSSWGSPYETWLWGDKCEAYECNSNHTLNFRNITVTTGK